LFGIIRITKYSFIGSFRFRNQRISFEIIFFFFIFILIFFNKNLKINFKFNFFILILFFIILILLISELNRSPFDFSEGESELIGGFNTEFSSLIFTFLFIGEYIIIIFFRYFFSILLNLSFVFVLLLFVIIFLRSSYPRFRFDFLISLF
jgi:NADH:ubiquinone oxidoreductase subunit H